MIINYTGIADNRIAPLAAEQLDKRPGQGLIICASAARARRIASDLSFFSHAKILVLPDLDAASLRYDAKSTGQLAQQLAVLTSLCSGEQCIVVAPVMGALKKLPPASVYGSALIRIDKDSLVERDRLIEKLGAMGYERNSTAEAPGQFAVRGEIIDIFVPGAGMPVRIELFDNEIDSMRSYDPMTQRSVKHLDSILISPARVLVKDEEAFARASGGIASAYNRAAGAADAQGAEKLREQRDYLIECIEEDMNFQYLEGYISYFYDEPQHVWDYMKSPSFIAVDDPSRVAEALDFYEKEDAEARRILLERHQGIKKDFASYPDPSDLELVNAFSSPDTDVWYTMPFAQRIRYTDRLDALKDMNSAQAPVFGGHMDVLETELRRFAKKGYKIVIACSSSERSDNLKDFLARRELAGRVELRQGSLSAGSEFPTEKLLYLSESDIFPHTKQRSRSRQGRRREIKAFTDINVGDYVVHENHGVGRFTGVEKLAVDGSVRDYLKICYAANDVLYIPVDQMESIQKYVGSEGVEPKINRLSGTDWVKTKARAKAAIKDMAEDFLRLSAERALNPGYQFGPDSVWQKEFEEAFPYEETDDQLRCAEEIKRDMEKPSAMDRLLCGDVGYGKTEVAARAVFKCLEQGKQAAVLVPTTILANQHFYTFKERMADYPFNIQVLSRFRTARQQDQIIEDLARGDVDLVVGTHRLLSSDVRFKDLGLLVIDEEQRFGVEHKEALKKLKANVDVLTLSATPIPRTLHMSLIGVRDMSVIEEPPMDRYPVQTYVMEQDDQMIADLIRREIERDGQVYVVYNRVRGIQAMARRLQELVPEAKISVGHGQMAERQLEDVMMDFMEGGSQVLLATTIIESGLDIPNVNTMIILDADRFGLSQLYQLRGRVGRSSRIAYCYLMYKKDKVLSELAEKRLRAIREFTEFGSGFRVAMRDLELRGAGNVLGVEQSGHMLSIGYELYCKLVDEAVAELKGRTDEERPLEADSAVELALAAYLPESYVADELTRLSMYKRIASVYNIDDRMEVTDELLDRFGDLPREAENLLDVAMIRNQASRCGISKVVQQQNQLVFLFEERNALDPQMFIKLMDKFEGRLNIFGGTSPRISLTLSGVPVAQEALALLECFMNK